MDAAWENFKRAARRETPDEVPVALIVDSPWLPGFAGIDTRDYFVLPDQWLAINLGLLDRFPGAVWIPGFWVEYGMAAEPSAFGCRMLFHPDSPPSIEPLVEDFTFWANHIKRANPQTDGLMPLVVRQYRAMDEQLRADGLGIRMVACRGPLTVTSWLAGIAPFMMDMVMAPDRVEKVLDIVTDSLIAWLQAQLDALHAPEGILVLDDIVGMVSAEHYEQFAAPRLKRIFAAFEGLIRIYHNDTPCAHLHQPLSEAGFDVFNFSHKANIADIKATMGQRMALMGNVPPLELGARGTPEAVYASAMEVLNAGAPGGGLILSFGGGVSMHTPAENIDALLQAARDWSASR